jgi:hypothetical protein
LSCPSTGGKQKLGAVSKRGERTIRRLLIIGASALVQQASRRGAPKGSRLAQIGSQAENAGQREFVQVLRLLEVFRPEDVLAGVREAIARGCNRF